MNDIFEYMNTLDGEKNEPLAYKMRPKNIDEIIGQEHILGEGKLLRRCIEADRLSSVIFYGPPGVGKTTIAMVIANTTKSEFMTLNATVSSKKDMQEVIDMAENIKKMYNKKTILFIDEIHRFNKAQQDYLLPFVENGTIILIGATTENPYFEVNNALLSRSIIFKLEPLDEKGMNAIIDRCIADGYSDKNISITQDARKFIVSVAGGDARRIYNALELAILSEKSNEINIDLDIVSECMQVPALNYDKDGDNHYDTISAFIKSMRGSDVDATIYYLAKMLVSGEDIKFIARRIIICSSEDVGNADPMALVVATNASLAVERIGMPEARIILAQAAAYVALAPKSNASYNAINAAMVEAKNGNYTIPSHLRDGHYSGATKLGNAKGYKYAHDFDNHYVKQQYLPKEIADVKFYNIDGMGYEKKLKDYMNKLRGEN